MSGSRKEVARPVAEAHRTVDEVRRLLDEVRDPDELVARAAEVRERLQASLATLEGAVGAELRAVVATLAGFMALVSLNVALLALYWDTHRTAVAIGSCVFYVVLGTGAGLALRWGSRRVSAPLVTLGRVLAEDERAIRDLL